jgi:condensin complex subunit 2
MRGQKGHLGGDGEVDENFWEQAAAEQAGRASGEGDESKDLPCPYRKIQLMAISAENGGAIPFNTQFFHEDYDDGPGFDDGFDAPPDAGEQDLLAATAGQTRRVRPELVNYAKRAKRVDVRKLKENIWKGLDIIIEKVEEDQMVSIFLGN